MHQKTEHRWSNTLSLAVVAATFDPQQIHKQPQPADANTDAQQPPPNTIKTEENTPPPEH